MTSRRWASEERAAEYADASANTIRRWREQGRINGYKVGRLVRYDLNEIDAMLAATIGEAAAQ